MAGVKFQNICKSYDQKTEVIRDFNLEIRDREFLVLVGPSGCGKSTLLRMIAGLEEVSKGDLWIGDQRVNDLTPRDRNIAMVFQNYALYPHMTVGENMAFSLKLRGTPKEELRKKVNEVAEILGMEKLLDRRPKQLSGGQRQRVAMGRAIVRNPEVFLFDEPLSNLDAKLRVQMRIEIARLHKRLKSTIVYVTHDQTEAMTLADRIVVLKDGFLQQVGTPLELYERPINSFVGSFIGSPSMNQIPVVVKPKDGTLVLSAPGLSLPLSPEKARELESHKGATVLLGIRPPDLFPQRGKGPVIQVEVEVIEPMGGESFIYFTLDKKQWVSRCEGLALIREEEVVQMEVNMEKIHFFSEDGKERLSGTV